MHKVIIDANVWIRFARSKDIAPLIDRFIAYDLIPIATIIFFQKFQMQFLPINGWISML
jgi:hypothetical protein